MVRRNETRKRRSMRPKQRAGHREVKLSGQDTLYAYCTDASGQKQMIVLTVPPGLMNTKVMVSTTAGMVWKVGPPPLDDIQSSY